MQPCKVELMWCFQKSDIRIPRPGDWIRTCAGDFVRWLEGMETELEYDIYEMTTVCMDIPGSSTPKKKGKP